MSHPLKCPRCVPRLVVTAVLLFSATHSAPAQRLSPAAFIPHRDSISPTARAERLGARDPFGRLAADRVRVEPDSVRTASEKIAAVIGGALLGGAVGLAVAAIYAPKIYCDICIAGNAESESRNKYFFRGPLIGAAGGAVIGWWFFGR